MELNRNNIRKIRGLIVFTIIILIGLYRFDVVVSAVAFILHILSPFILGCAIAFILNVPMVRFHKLIVANPFVPTNEKKLHRLQKLATPFSLLLSIIFVVVLLFIVTAVVLPQVATTATDLAQTLPEKVPSLVKKLEGFLVDYPEALSWLESFQIDWQHLVLNTVDFAKSGAGAFLGSTIGMAKGIVTAFTTFFIGFVFACYILLQKETLSRQSRKLLFAFLPKSLTTQLINICSLTHKTFTNFIAGQCLEAVILGTMFFLVMTIFRFPYALLVGVLIAFTALIPIFGAFVGCFVGTFLILTVNPPQAIAFVVLFLILQQVEGNLIYPHIVGGSVGLPSIWVLAAVTIGGSLFGVIGMLVFIPIVSVIYTLLRETTNHRLNQKQLNIK